MGNKSSSRNKERNPSKKSKRGSFCLLTNSNGRRRKAIRVRAGGSTCTPPPLTGRESSGAEQRDYGGVEWRRIQSRPAPAEPSEGGTGTGRGGLVPGRARFGISRGVPSAWGGGWRVDRSHLPSSDGRSPRRTSPHLTCFACKRSRRHVHASRRLYFPSTTAGRWLPR